MSFVFHPAAALEIDGRRLTAAEAGIERIEVVLGVGAHGFATLDLWPKSKFADAAAGSAAAVLLGDEETVLTGTVATVSRHPSHLRIELLDATAPLSRTRTSATFRDLSVADIVRNLAGEAEVETDTIAGDLKLEVYAVDTRRSLWRHLNDLAALVGADLTATGEGKLRFAEGSGGATRTLRFGADLLDWRTETRPDSDAPGFAAHGAASEGGSRLWHHLLRDPLGDAPSWSRIPGAVRSREAAESAKKAAAARAARAKTPAFALTIGQPLLRPGDTVEIAGLDDGGGPKLPAVGSIGLGGSSGGTLYRARSVRHRFNGVQGFTTALELEGTGEDAAGAGSLAALAGGLV